MGSPRQAISTAVGRFYVWPPAVPETEQEKFISVTNAINTGIPKPNLKTWSEKMIAEFAVDHLDLIAQTKKSANGRAAAINMLKQSPYLESERGMALGTLIHDCCEAIVLGTPLPKCNAEQERFVAAFRQFVNDFEPEFEATEATVYNRTYGYAGTLDFVATIPGYGRVLGDYKTTKPNARTGHGIYPETALQLSAYRYAEFMGGVDGLEYEMAEVDCCLAVNLRPEGYKVVPVQADEAVFRTFLYALEVAQFVQDGTQLVGDPCGPVAPRSDRRPTMPPNVAALVD